MTTPFGKESYKQLTLSKCLSEFNSHFKLKVLFKIFYSCVNYCFYLRKFTFFAVKMNILTHIFQYLHTILLPIYCQLQNMLSPKLPAFFFAVISPVFYSVDPYFSGKFFK